MNTEVMQSSQLSLSALQGWVLLGAVALVIFVPGLVVVLAGALSGPERKSDRVSLPGPPFVVVALAAAPAVTFGGASLLTGFFNNRGVRWNGTSFTWGFVGLVVASALIGALLWIISSAIVSRVRARRAPESPVNLPDRPDFPGPRMRVLVGTATAVGVGAAAVLSADSIVRAVGGLDSTVPTFDALFHSTAMRWIAENGQACATCLGEVNEPEHPNPYYPSAYHAVGAIGVLLTGWQLPGTYVALIALTAPIFVLGSVAMASEFGARNVALFVAAIVAVIVPFFPTELVSYGQLAPFGMAVAALPGVIAAVAAALRRPSPGVVPIVALGVLGIVSLHPSVGIVVIAVAFLQGVGAVGSKTIDWFRRHRGVEVPRSGSMLWVVLGAAVAGALTLATVQTGVADELSVFSWPAVDTIGGSFEVLALLVDSPEMVRVLVLSLAVVGLVGILTWRAGFRRALPTVIVGAVALWLAILCRGSDEQWTIDLTYLWWNDWRRLAAISVIAWVAAAAIGAQALMRLLMAIVRERHGRSRWIVPMLLAVVLVVWSTTVAVRTEASRSELASAGWIEDDRLVTDAELDAYAWLADNFDGGTVLNDPDDGSPWLYTLYGVPVVFNVPLGRNDEVKHGKERVLLNQFAHDAGVPGAIYRDEANTAIDDLDVRWVIHGPTRVFHKEETAGGFLKLDESPAFRLVYENDGVMIYQVDRRLIASQS